jgi:fumarylacetoacetate (FAA) hydrolase family protein
MSAPENFARFLPSDGFAGLLIGRAWLPAPLAGGFAGPSPVFIAEAGVFDLSSVAPTCADLINAGPVAVLRGASGSPSGVPPGCARLGSYADIMANTLAAKRDPGTPHFLSPVDLQAVKACGVTFAVSMMERVIEERAAGDAKKADAIRGTIRERIGTDLSRVKPGSPQAEDLKNVLKAEGLWSQYLEVGIGPYAEVFTKSQPLSSVGTGAEVGILSVSAWNNPEPETVLIVDSRGAAVGAALGNDVNLRDIEGRSALLLGKAKDNNASCAIGPFIRLFDGTFTLDDVRNQDVGLVVEGEDGFRLSEASHMTQISRDVLDLVAQTINENHQYPDGLALFTGTLFAPTQDRDGAGKGFTHKIGDVVRIRAEKLGTLENRVNYCHAAPPWDFGVSALMKNLHQRGLL